MPRRLARLLTEIGSPVEVFPDRWKGMKDGALLDALEREGYVVLLTCDRNMPFQQKLAGRRVGLVILPGQRLSALVPLLVPIAQAVVQATPGCVVTVDTAGNLSRVA